MQENITENTAQQLVLPDFISEPYSYHQPDRRGFFAMLHGGKNPKARKTQKIYKLDQLAWVLDNLNPKVDTWISQGEFFRPNRRVVNLSRMGLCFVDLDTYSNPALKNRNPADLAQYTRYFCDQEGIPQPSIIVYSGRGLQLKWIFDKPVPAAALPRWNRVQSALITALLPLGADKSARDASRVLRVEQTVNTKSGDICRVLDIADSPYSFDNLADEVLPITREHHRANQERKQLQLINTGGGNTSGLRKLSGNRLAWDRLNDLRKLVVMRGGVEHKTTMLHWQLNFLLLSGAANANTMFHEARELASQITGGTWQANSNELTTLYRKAQQMASGSTVEFDGKLYTPMYTPKNDTLINLFGITDDEQRQLQTIISKDMADARHAERERARRAANGAKPRAEYEANSLSAQKPWQAQGISRSLWYKMGKPESVDKSVRITNGGSP